jgi:hypothetical protein
MDKKKLLRDFEDALKGLDFPTSRSAIVNKVKDIGGIDGHVAEVASQMPDRTYDWQQDAAREFTRLLVEHEVFDDDAVPAAPSRLDSADKGLVEHMADPRRGEP